MDTPPKKPRHKKPPIRDWETFTVEQLADRRGVRPSSVLALIRQGLRSRRIFRTHEISGRDYRRFVEQRDPPCQDNA